MPDESHPTSNHIKLEKLPEIPTQLLMLSCGVVPWLKGAKQVKLNRLN